MLVVQIIVAVLLAPVLASESFRTDPGLLAMLVLSLAAVAAGTRWLAGTRVVERVVATD